MTFKEQLVEDNKGIFMNPDEFSEFHVINGQEMAVQIDGNEMIEREKYRSEIYAEGVYKKKLLLYVRAEDFGKLPAVGRVLTLDGKKYTVSDAVDEAGIYSLSLEAHKT